jgi:hypothetical protein
MAVRSCVSVWVVSFFESALTSCGRPSAAGGMTNFHQETAHLPVTVMEAVSAGLPRKFEATEAEPYFRKAVELEPLNGDVRDGCG